MELKEMKIVQEDLMFVLEKLLSYLTDEQVTEFNSWILEENERVLDVLKGGLTKNEDSKSKD